jgi:hypothetical protein
MRRDVRDEVRATGTEEYWAVVGLGRIHRRRYAYRHADTYQQNVSEFCKNNKKSDTPRIRIGRVSDTYPYPKRIGHAIRLFPEVSVFHRKQAHKMNEFHTSVSADMLIVNVPMRIVNP